MQWKPILLTLLVSVVAASADGQCADGYSTTDNRICYKLFLTATAKVNRTVAAATCAMDGGYLASVPSAYNDNYLKQMMTNYYVSWLGITCTGSQAFCKNDDGTPFGAYSNFTPGSNFTGQKCVYKSLSNGWQLNDCSDSNYFFCELPIGSACPSGYSFWRGSCYSVSSGAVSETEAGKRCAADNANLTSIHSDDENAHVLALAPAKKFCYSLVRIGL